MPCLKDECYKSLYCGVEGGIVFCEYPDKICSVENSKPNLNCTEY